MKPIAHSSILLIALLLTGQCPVFSKETTAFIKGNFRYKHAECTGQNQWIYINGKLIPIQFDNKKSNQAAIKALSALLPEVLGPNADGKITLFGSYEKRKTPLPSGPHSGDPPGSFYHSFVLSDWRIQTPFTRLIITNGDNIPQEFRSVRLSGLTANEFNNCEGFEPGRFSSRSKQNILQSDKLN